MGMYDDVKYKMKCPNCGENVNRFSIAESGTGKPYIELDIRDKEE